MELFLLASNFVFLLGQASFDGGVEGLDGILKLLRTVAFLLAVGALIISGILFGQGRVESAIHGVLAAGILALSGAIVKFAFEVTGEF